METTDSVSLIFFFIYVVQAEPTCSFVIFFSLTGRQTVAFSLLIYSNASNGRNRIYFALWKQRPGAIIPLRWGGEAVSPLKAPLDKSQWKKIFNASETGIMSAWWLMSNPFMHLHFSKKGLGGGETPVLLQRVGEVGCPLSIDQSASTLLQRWVFIAS